MITKLDKKVPRDIRAAVEGTLHGWLRLHRFQITMAFPTIDTATAYLGTHQSALVHQFQRLERDTGAKLYHRAAVRKPHRPTPRGQALLRDLAQDHIHQLMNAALGEQIRPTPDPATLVAAQHHASRPPRTPAPLKPFDDINVKRLRMTKPLKAVLRDLIDHPGEFYGQELLNRTNIGAGIIYPILHRLHHAGWLTSRPEDEHEWLAGAPPGRGPGRRRTYYTLTPEGRRAARHELEHHKRRNRKKSANR